MVQSNMSDVTIHKNVLLRKFRVEENCRLRQKYSICLLEEVVVLGYFANKAQVVGRCSVSLCLFLLPCSMTTGACSQHIVSNISHRCVDIQIDLLYNILYNLH